MFKFENLDEVCYKNFGKELQTICKDRLACIMKKIENNICKEINYLTDVHIVEKEQQELDLNKWTFEIMQEIICKIDNPMIKLIFIRSLYVGMIMRIEFFFDFR